MDGYETNGLSVLTGVLQSNYSLYMLRLASCLSVQKTLLSAITNNRNSSTEWTLARSSKN